MVNRKEVLEVSLPKGIHLRFNVSRLSTAVDLRRSIQNHLIEEHIPCLLKSFTTGESIGNVLH